MDLHSARVPPHADPSTPAAAMPAGEMRPAPAWPSPAATGPKAMAARPARPAQLLLFVGEAIRPDAALVALLAREGQRCLSLPGPEQAVRAAALARFDAVLVDAALLDGGAARAIEALVSSHGCPLVVLAEEADEVDEIVALELGADLYLARPLAPRRLRAHLRALLRRREVGAVGAVGTQGTQGAQGTEGLQPGGPGAAGRVLQAGGWTLHVAQQRLTCGTRAVRLTQAQAALLRCLMAAAGDIVPGEDLQAALPQHDRQHTGSLRVHVHRLRQRLRDEGVHELQVQAVRGSGYALAVPDAQAA